MNSERKDLPFFFFDTIHYRENRATEKKNTTNIFYSLGFSVLLFCFSNHSLKSITMSLESYSTKLPYEHSNMQLD
jgi:hypothetical protein